MQQLLNALTRNGTATHFVTYSDYSQHCKVTVQADGTYNVALDYRVIARNVEPTRLSITLRLHGVSLNGWQ